MALADTRAKLDLWGIWLSGVHGGVPGYESSTAAIMRMGGTKKQPELARIGAKWGSERKGVEAPLLTDDEAMAIDRVIARLRADTPDAGRAVIRWYYMRESVLRISKAMGVSRPMVKELLAGGEGYIDAVLTWGITFEHNLS